MATSKWMSGIRVFQRYANFSIVLIFAKPWISDWVCWAHMHWAFKAVWKPISKLITDNSYSSPQCATNTSTAIFRLLVFIRHWDVKSHAVILSSNSLHPPNSKFRIRSLIRPPVFDVWGISWYNFFLGHLRVLPSLRWQKTYYPWIIAGKHTQGNMHVL